MLVSSDSQSAESTAAPGQRTAVLLIDVINAFDFPGSEGLVAAAEQAASKIQALAARARLEGVPVIYVNDNFGQWLSDFRQTVEACLAPESAGRNVTRQLRPLDGDYFVLKPMHSSFFSTPLELVLRHLSIERLVLCGFAADLCVLFTAHDAHMRQFKLAVPSDCTAANSPEIAERALSHLRDTIHCATEPSGLIEF